MCTKVCPDCILGMNVVLLRLSHRSLIQGVLTHTSRKALDPHANNADGSSVAMLKLDPLLYGERINCCSLH